MRREVDQLEGLEGLTEIGRGGFGVVYRATEIDLNRTVAVKVLNDASADIARKRLDRERRAMGVLSGHPNIVTIYRSGMAGGSPFLVMEFLGGGSLADRLQKGPPLSWQEAVTTGIALADAVYAAHQAGVLHRDIKPANVLVSDSGVPKLGDFGIANVDTVTQTSGVLKATIAHAPPEVLGGREGDARADVYSLASTIYELITGRPAFVRPEDTSPVPVLMRITSEPVPNIDPALCPPTVTRCLQQAMSKDPNLRPSTADDFRQVLIAAAHNAPPATSVSPVESPRRADPTPRPDPSTPATTDATPAGPAPASPGRVPAEGVAPTTTSPGPAAVAPTGPAATGPPADKQPAPKPSTADGPTLDRPAVSPPVVDPFVDDRTAAGSTGTEATRGATPNPAPSAQPEVEPVAQDASHRRVPPPDYSVPISPFTAQQRHDEHSPYHVETRPRRGGGTTAIMMGGIAAALLVIASLAWYFDRSNDGPTTSDGGAVNGDVFGAPTSADQFGNDAPGDDTDSGSDDLTDDFTPDASSVEGRLRLLTLLGAGELANTSGFDTLPEYPRYTRFTSSNAAIAVTVPTAWDDRRNISDPPPFGIQISTDIDGGTAAQAESGVAVTLYETSSLTSSDPDDVLDLIIVANGVDCVQAPSAEFSHRLFSGSYATLSGCPALGADVVSIEMVGLLEEGSGYLLRVAVTSADEESIAAAQVVLDSLQINLGAL